MEITFSSVEELYKRVKPALYAKLMELHRLGYGYLHDADLWNYLVEIKWFRGRDLMLSDIVDDIMHIDEKEIEKYVQDKVAQVRRKKYFDREQRI